MQLKTRQLDNERVEAGWIPHCIDDGNSDVPNRNRTMAGANEKMGRELHCCGLAVCTRDHKPFRWRTNLVS